MKKRNLSFFVLVIFLLTGCVTHKNIINKGDLCGLIVDENNKPISNFVIYVSKNNMHKYSAITNNSGIFVFPDMEIGEYEIYGEKENYIKLEKNNIIFRDSSSLLCCQLFSLKSAIEKTISYLKIGEFEKAKELIEDIVLNDRGLGANLILAFSAYIDYKLGNTDIAKDKIGRLKQISTFNISDFIKKMEVSIYEM